jgi:hypothetical protein
VIEPQHGSAQSFFGDAGKNVLKQIERLQRSDFPYDMSFLFWVGQWPNGEVDNTPPDDKLPEKATAWNAKYAAPKVVIGLVGDYFREFEHPGCGWQKTRRRRKSSGPE